MSAAPLLLVTGATGFVGRAVVARALAKGLRVRVAGRRPDSWPAGVEERLVGDFAGPVDWPPALAGVDLVAHCAARVHVMHETSADPLAEFRRLNVAATLALATAAGAAGVRRRGALCSIKVNGEATAPGRPFTAADEPAPDDAYGLSKLEMERALLALAAQGGPEVAIIRSPLVYGPGVKANFLALLRWIQRGRPLPLGALRNRRSLVAVDNLADLVVTCATHPAAANRVFLASDGEDLSTTALCRRLGTAMNRPARLWPVPAAWLRLAGKMTGRQDQVDRLCGSLEVDLSETRRILGWTPPVTVDEALRKTVAAP
jgi:nucleoside-diphosphate-sugar epimerase